MGTRDEFRKHFRIHDVTLELAAADGETLDCMIERLPPGTEITSAALTFRPYQLLPSDDSDGLFDLTAGDAQLARGAQLSRVLDVFESDLDVWIAAATRDFVLVHSGVVGWRGRALVFPGSSFAGKTTIVTELIKLGAQYYSDDYAVFDPAGRVLPYPRPLAIREANGARVNRDAADFGAITASAAIPVGLVVDTCYREGAVWRPRNLTSGETVLAMLRNAPAARYRPKHILERLQAGLQNAVGIAGDRGEAAVMAPHLLERFADWAA